MAEPAIAEAADTDLIRRSLREPEAFAMSPSAGELKKWRAADGSCFSHAVKEVLGKTVIFRPNLKPARARPYLDKEIKAALKDLRCGKDFYPAYSPKAIEITSRVYQGFGREGAAQAIPSRIYLKLV
ncbi:hypothetical protein ACQP2T_30585 [Nonomuraea sp. CA-143628]|uniref:hypothetical protein n=1 Tax=Nonomuraea sp. CA-143628 TaxID=3239997 RepID=UPI003D8D2341